MHEPYFHLSGVVPLFRVGDPDLCPADVDFIRESFLLPPLAHIVEETGRASRTYVFENAGVIFRAAEIGANLDVRSLESGMEIVQDVLQSNPA